MQHNSNTLRECCNSKSKADRDPTKENSLEGQLAKSTDVVLNIIVTALNDLPDSL